MEVVASLSQGRTAAAQCGLFTHKSVPVIFEPPCICILLLIGPYMFRRNSCLSGVYTNLVKLPTNVHNIQNSAFFGTDKSL